jgi:hypothetical protein
VLGVQVTVGAVMLTQQPIVKATSAATYGVCGATMWFDADDATTITQSAGLITQWRDKSGFARHANTSAGPFVLGAQLAGRSILRFDGTSQFLPISDVISGRPYTVFVAERRRVSRGLNYLLGGSTTGTGLNLHLGYRVNATATQAHWGNDLDHAIPAFVSVAAEPARVFAARWQSGARALRVNANVGTNDATPNGVTSWSGAAIGRYFDGSANN